MDILFTNPCIAGGIAWILFSAGILTLCVISGAKAGRKGS